MKKEGDLLGFILGFLAGGALVGIPVGFFLETPWQVTIGVVVVSGIAGGLYGDRFLHEVADSDWWDAIRGYFRRLW